MREATRVMGLVALLRCGVGAVLIASPDVATNGDAGRRVLVRTIGIRDLVVGAASLRALRGDEPARRLWIQAGLASDAADVALAVASRRELGRSGTLVAALTPVPFVIAGIAGVRQVSDRQLSGSWWPPSR